MDAKYLKTCNKFVLFIVSPKNMMLNKNFLKITLKKLNHKPSGSTEMAHKYLACQFFFTIAVVHGSLK